MFNIYIITLANSDAGRHSEEAKKQLTKTLNSCRDHGWPVQIFHAVNGYNLDATIWSTLDLKSPKKKTGSSNKFADKPGAMGCFLSHFLLWKKCTSLNKPVIILEDDIQVISSLTEIKSNHECLKLHAPRQRKENETVGRWSPGAFGYWLSPIGAQKLVNFSLTNGPKYNDKCIGSKVLDWDYINTPLIRLRLRRGSSTNPVDYPYKDV